MLLWGNTQLVIEGVVPDILHVVPVSHSSILNWMAEVQAGNSSLGPSLGPHVRVLYSEDLLEEVAPSGGGDVPRWRGRTPCDEERNTMQCHTNLNVKI